MSDKTGGPAFPHGPGGDSWQHEDGRVSHQWPAHPGMDLLDWFAGQALSGLVSDSKRGGTFEAFAEDAYTYASAMLTEKARREATCKDYSQVPDHSPDAGKMARLEEENRDLVEALGKFVEAGSGWSTHEPTQADAFKLAHAVLSKHQTHKKEAGHE